MKRIIKKTPATINGKDCLELLVKDDCMHGCTPCELCCYRYWVPDDDVMADCATVHGCTINYDYYFMAQPKVFND